MAYVLAGGRGSRLVELTDRRAKPAVYFGGKSRIVDFALSNAYNSGIRHIAVATQYKAHSLIRHLHRGWNFLRPIRNESFDILPASQRVSESLWYLGTADAVYQNIDIIEGYDPEYLVVLAGDHVYKMDYEPMLQQHVEQGADVTVGCIEVPREEASGFGVMHVDDKDVIRSFVEKPADPPAMHDKPDMSLASMGIYVFETKFLLEELRRDAADPSSSHDFGKDIIPYLVTNGRAVAHSFERSCVRSEAEKCAYWRDVGTVDAYWAANIDLTDVVPDLDLYDQDWPIWSYNEVTPPAKFVHDEDGRRGQAISSLVSGGCIISGAALRHTLLSTGARVNSFSIVENAVILPYVNVGRSSRLKNVVIDAQVKIPEGLIVGEDPELDAKRFRRTERGICLITQPMIDRYLREPKVTKSAVVAIKKPATNGLDAAAAGGLDAPAAGLDAAAAGGLDATAANGLSAPAASGLEEPASALEEPVANGIAEPAAASGLEEPAADGLAEPIADGLKA
jgi:glucose-1-phosphate adenylyltransferase